MITLLKSSYFSDLSHISSNNGKFTYQIWYDEIIFEILSGFRIFFPELFWIFIGYSSILQISVVLATFLYIMDNLLFKYDMMIKFSRTSPVSGFVYNLSAFYSNFKIIGITLDFFQTFSKFVNHTGKI